VQQPDDEEVLLRSVAIRNANSILLARQRAEQELLQAKQALEARTEALARALSMARATLQSTTDGILAVDEDGKVTDFNQKFAEMWRISFEIIRRGEHRAVLEVMSRQTNSPEAFLAQLERIRTSAAPESFDLLELVDGRAVERVSRVQIVEGRTVGRVWSFRDVTAHRRAEAAAQAAAEERKRLLDSERAARAEAERASGMKDEFLANLSHELRTPLTAILGWSQVLRRRAAGEPELRAGLEAIERNARAQAQLIEDLLDMNRIASGKVHLETRPVAPAAFIEAAIETVRPAAEAKGIRLEKRLDAAAGAVSGDPGRLQQVLWNLLSNAIKFTPRDGKVDVVLERAQTHIEISVTDTGIGIKPDHFESIFARFRQAETSLTREHGGLGLGLAIVKQLVQLHGGTVRVASAGAGQGATFVVRLPLIAAAANTSLASGRAASGMNPVTFKWSDLSGVKVLVVDDQADARELVKRVLTECNAEVLSAGSADEALRLVEREHPHVLVSDIGMPGIDGYELLRRVRAFEQVRGGRIPAIALTAFARSEDRTQALRAGFLVHVSKPVEPAELVATVASVAGRTGEPDATKPPG
jgi:signal transduction histidine kinase/ActR/RegA family two-component response regulator